MKNEGNEMKDFRSDALLQKAYGKNETGLWSMKMERCFAVLNEKVVKKS